MCFPRGVPLLRVRQIHMEVSAPRGQITLSTTAGLAFEVGDGVADGLLVFKGHVSDVNRALRGALYRGKPNWNTRGAAPNNVTIMATNSHKELGGLEPVKVEAEAMFW